MEKERTRRRTKVKRTASEIDSEKTRGRPQRSWRSVVKAELGKLLKGETELRDIVYWSDKLAG